MTAGTSNSAIGVGNLGVRSAGKPKGRRERMLQGIYDPKGGSL